VQVDVIDGTKGELTVSVDGREVANKSGDSMPEASQVLSAVRGQQAVGAGG
jgi:hypothetical protein